MMCSGFFCLSGLALSVKACRLCQLSQRESPWHNGNVSGIVQRRPLGGAGERSEPEGGGFSTAESGTANVVSRYDPSRENRISERPQAFRYPEI